MSFLANINPNFTENKKDFVERKGQEIQPESVGFADGLTDVGQLAQAAYRGAVVEPAITLGLAGASVTSAIDSYADTELTDWWLENSVDIDVKAREELKIDPNIHGTAMHVLDSLFSLLPQAALYGPIGTGIATGIADTTDNLSKNIPLETASKLGVATGITNAIGVALPAAFASNKIPVNMLAQRVGSGAVGNLAIGVPSDMAKHDILKEAGFEAMANQYKWNDPTNRAIDLIMGAAFGGLAHHQARGFKKVHVDAAMTLKEAQVIDNSAPGIPTTPQAANAHVDTFYKAVKAVRNGDSFDKSVNPSEFIEINKLDDIEPEQLIAKPDVRTALNKSKPEPIIRQPVKEIDIQSFDTNETMLAKQAISEKGDTVLIFEDADGNPVEMSAKQALESLDKEMSFIDKIEAGTEAAINCFLRFGL